MAPTAQAQRGGQSGNPTGRSLDPRLKKMLDKVSLPYEVLGNGSAKLVFNVTGSTGRTQMLFANSVVQRTGAYEARTLYTLVYKGPRRLTQVQYERILLMNMQTAVGTYALLDLEGEYALVLMTQVPAVMKPEDLKAVMMNLVGTADRMERELTNEDRF
jgi:hypothetical protein